MIGGQMNWIISEVFTSLGDSMILKHLVFYCCVSCHVYFYSSMDYLHNFYKLEHVIISQFSKKKSLFSNDVEC